MAWTGLLVGRAAARRLGRTHRAGEGRGLPEQEGMCVHAGKLTHTAAPGILNLVEQDAPSWSWSTFADKFLVRRVSPRSLEAFRWMMVSQSHRAVWQSPTAYQQPDCPGCEANYFSQLRAVDLDGGTQIQKTRARGKQHHSKGPRHLKMHRA
jgi:hypothetical protein